MSTTQFINKEIAKIPNGEPFTVENLKHYGKWPNIQRSLSRLTRSGEIRRIGKGIYAKPKIVKGIEIVRTGKLLVECIEKITHETVIISGAHAINILGISSQGQMQEMYYWTGRTKMLNVDGVLVKLQYINKKYVNKSDPLLELLLSSAYFLGKEMFTVETLKLVEHRVGREKILELKQYLPQIPKWVMIVFSQYFNSSK